MVLSLFLLEVFFFQFVRAAGVVDRQIRSFDVSLLQRDRQWFCGCFKENELTVDKLAYLPTIALSKSMSKQSRSMSNIPTERIVTWK